MKKVLVVILLIFPRMGLCDSPERFTPYSASEMFDITLGAAQKRPDVSLLIKNSEEWAWRQARKLGIDQISPAATFLSPIVAQKISTRTTQIGWTPARDLILRPDVEYYFVSKEWKTFFSVSWRF